MSNAAVIKSNVAMNHAIVGAHRMLPQPWCIGMLMLWTKETKISLTASQSLPLSSSPKCETELPLNVLILKPKCFRRSTFRQTRFNTAFEACVEFPQTMYSFGCILAKPSPSNHFWLCPCIPTPVPNPAPILGLQTHMDIPKCPAFFLFCFSMFAGWWGCLLYICFSCWLMNKTLWPIGQQDRQV